MEKEKNAGTCDGTCGAIWGHHHWGHMLIKVLIVVFVFWCGVQFGELKAMVKSLTGESYRSGPGFMMKSVSGWSQGGAVINAVTPESTLGPAETQ